MQIKPIAIVVANSRGISPLPLCVWSMTLNESGRNAMPNRQGKLITRQYPRLL